MLHRERFDAPILGAVVRWSGTVPLVPPLFVVRDLRAYLRGPWHLARRTRDERSRVTTTFEGSAAFVVDGTGLAYEERGVHDVDGRSFPATRSYAYTFPALDRAEVWFPDGRPFHVLDLGSGRCHAEHPCREDRYTGSFQCEGPDVWTVEWMVHGPEKAICITSRYARLPASWEG